MKALLTLLAALTASTAIAGESQDYCALLQNQATVRTEILGSAEAFANTSPTQGEKLALVVGVKKSLSGLYQAGIVTDIARADCDAHASRLKAVRALTRVEAQIDRQVLELRGERQRQALAAAEEALSVEKSMLKAQTATWADLRTAMDARDRLKQLLAQEQQDLAVLSTMPAFDGDPLGQTVAQSTEAQMHAVELRGKLDAAAAWDLSVSLGGKRDLTTNQQSPYVSINYSRSFGLSRSEAAASRSAGLAGRFAEAEEGGPAQMLAKKRIELAGVYAGLLVVQENLKERIELIHDTRSRASQVATTPAARLVRNLRVEELALEADLAGAELRLRLLAAWLAAQKPA